MTTKNKSTEPLSSQSKDQFPNETHYIVSSETRKSSEFKTDPSSPLLRRILWAGIALFFFMGIAILYYFS